MILFQTWPRRTPLNCHILTSTLAPLNINSQSCALNGSFACSAGVGFNPRPQPTKNDVSSNFMMDLKIMISQDDETGLIHLQSDERRTVYDPFLGEIQD